MDKMSNSDKKRLFSLFENVDKTEIENRPEKSLNSDVLIIDGTNTFIRAFCANPALNDDGEHVGGIDGFFKSIGYAIRNLRPTRCIVVFDGKGGSKRRRKIFPDYKAKRKSRMRLNRIYEDMSIPDLESKSVLEQLQKVAILLQSLPITTMAIDNIEADDTISFLCTEALAKDTTESITIMSSDQDFYQLINDKVKVWSPTKKKMYGPLEIFNEFGIHSKNYIYYKSLNGDKSDNIDGIKGLGLKTAKKCFPLLTEEKQLSLDDIINHAKDNRNGKLKLWAKVDESQDILIRNFALMNLMECEIPTSLMLNIQDMLDIKAEKSNIMSFTQLLKKYRLLGVIKNHHIWMRETFDVLNCYVNK